MKKYLSIILCLTVLTLAGCGKEADVKMTVEDTPSANEEVETFESESAAETEEAASEEVEETSANYPDWYPANSFMRSIDWSAYETGKDISFWGGEVTLENFDCMKMLDLGKGNDGDLLYSHRYDDGSSEDVLANYASTAEIGDVIVGPTNYEDVINLWSEYREGDAFKTSVAGYLDYVWDVEQQTPVKFNKALADNDIMYRFSDESFYVSGEFDCNLVPVSPSGNNILPFTIAHDIRGTEYKTTLEYFLETYGCPDRVYSNKMGSIQKIVFYYVRGGWCLAVASGLNEDTDETTGQPCFSPNNSYEADVVIYPVKYDEQKIAGLTSFFDANGLGSYYRAGNFNGAGWFTPDELKLNVE